MGEVKVLTIDLEGVRAVPFRHGRGAATWMDCTHFEVARREGVLLQHRDKGETLERANRGKCWQTREEAADGRGCPGRKSQGPNNSQSTGEGRQRRARSSHFGEAPRVSQSPVLAEREQAHYSFEGGGIGPPRRDPKIS